MMKRFKIIFRLVIIIVMTNTNKSKNIKTKRHNVTCENAVHEVEYLLEGGEGSH